VFRAIADKNRFHKGYDATGIGAIACARHGATVPASVVDFQKGERQMNMDYSLCQVVKVVVSQDTRRIVFFYDISCSYCVNLGKRLAKSDGKLSLRETLEIVFGIGQFHVHGHQESCFGRFSPVFIEGIGWVSGEIVESNWSLINPVGLTCTSMTAAHRYEVLDAKILDLNWKKMTHLGAMANVCGLPFTELDVVRSLPNAYERATVELRDAQEALELLEVAIEPKLRATWEAELANAQVERLGGNIKAMDVLKSRVAKGKF
jgi:Kyakuja-Dileera-Zisupton transposase